MSPYNRLWTKTAFAKVPEIGAQDGKGDEAVAYVKIFSIRSDQRWYVLEYDPVTGRAFCLQTQNGDASYGYSAINGDGWNGESMQDTNDRMRLPPLERDSSFKPTKVSTIKEKCGTSCPA